VVPQSKPAMMPALPGAAVAQSIDYGLLTTPQAMRGGAPVPVPPATA
jgi:hypothetical protein